MTDEPDSPRLRKGFAFAGSSASRQYPVCHAAETHVPTTVCARRKALLSDHLPLVVRYARVISRHQTGSLRLGQGEAEGGSAPGPSGTGCARRVRGGNLRAHDSLGLAGEVQVASDEGQQQTRRICGCVIEVKGVFRSVFQQG